MKKKYSAIVWLSVTSVVAMLISPLVVSADSPSLAPPAQTVIITEIQTGAATAGDEFVELYNPTVDPIDITGWQVRYVNAGGNATTVLATIAAEGGQQVALPSHGYFTLHSAGVPIAGAGQVYTTGTTSLTKTDKTVALLAPDATLCQLVVQDAVAWASTPAGQTNGEGPPVDSSTISTSKDRLLQRLRDGSGAYVDTNDNAFDFAASTVAANGTTPGVATGATPGGDNTVSLPSAAAVPTDGTRSTLVVGMSDCVVPAPTTPDPPVDPGPAPGDQADTPPDSTTSDPSGSTGDSVDPPDVPSPNIGLTSLIITELLPDPAAPQSDDADEFVELYNPNDTVFDLGGYIVEAGITTKHRFVFADGGALAPHTYAALFSADTGLTLSNGGGQVRLLDPGGTVLDQTGEYPTAKESQAWALVGTSWQWTTVPTPNAQNVPSPAPIAKVASATTKATTKATAVKPKAGKLATVKAANAKVAKQSPAPTDASQNLSAVQPRTPLHPAVLALVAASALLYGAYEYRRDVANKLYQFRSNRAARRESR